MCLWLYTLWRFTQQVAACRVSGHDLPAIVILMPADIKAISLSFVSSLQKPCKCPDLAPLTGLAQLKDLRLAAPLDQPMPQLPALQSKWVVASDLQALSSVTVTLERLILVAPHIDFGQPYNLAHFTRLKTLSVDAQTIRNFKPEVLPPTLHSIVLGYNERQNTLDKSLALVLPVGGTMHREVAEEHLQHPRYKLRWTRTSLL